MYVADRLYALTYLHVILGISKRVLHTLDAHCHHPLLLLDSSQSKEYLKRSNYEFALYERCLPEGQNPEFIAKRISQSVILTKRIKNYLPHCPHFHT